MRRMYSKEQLQKLIDEVSRLIAIEELDKVVPVPSLAKAGYYMAVNSAGTGYELVPSPESTHLYYHGIELIDYVKKNVAEITILNNSSTSINTLDKLRAWAEAIEGLVIIGAKGCIKISDVVYHLYAIIKSDEGGNHIYKFGYLDSSGFVVSDPVDLDDSPARH